MVFPHTFRTEHTETKTTSGTYGEYYARNIVNKIRIQPALLKILQAVDSNRNQFLNNLTEIIKFRSVSGKLKYVDEIQKVIKFTEQWLTKLGIKYECFDIGSYNMENKTIKRPTVILGSLGSDSKKKTVCVYVHLDVKQPNKSNWNTDPWDVTEVDGRLYGCGVASGKMALIAWFNLILAFQETKSDIPVNFKFIIESLYYYGSDGLEEFISRRRQDFFFDVSCIVVCGSEWIGDKHPCLVYGSVGILHFTCTMEKSDTSDTDMKEDMKKIFEQVCDERGTVLIKKFNDYVTQITPDEEQIYERINDFDVEEVRDTLPEFQKTWDKVKLLMYFWRIPSMLLDDMQECTCEKNDKTIIKRNFIVKIVPKQIVDISTNQILQHIKKTAKELNIKHKINVELLSASRTWFEDIRSFNYKAARSATIQIYKEDPNMIRDDTDMKVVTLLSVISEKSVLVLPLGDKHIRAGQDNENIAKKNYFEGMKLLSAYIFQISYLTGAQ